METLNNKKRTGYLLKNIVIFGIGNIGTKFITFFMVPVYTNVLSTKEYGIADLIAAVSMLLAPVLTLNIEEAVMRFALDQDADHDKILSSGLTVILAGLAAGLFLIPAVRQFESVSQYAGYLYLYVFSMGVSQFFLCFLRGKELLVQYTAGNILNSFLIAGLNIVFLLYFRQGISGYLAAYIAANLITAVYAAAAGRVLRHMGNWSLDMSLLKSMVKYSAVLIPNSFMWWIMNSLDRVMVTGMIGSGANGIYSISYKFPALLAAFSGIFTKAWSYSAIREEASADKDAYSSQMFTELAAVMMVAAGGLIFVMKPFLMFYVSRDYYSAWKYTPFLIIGSVFLTMASFLSASYTVHKDSVGFLISGMTGAAVNVILNFVFISRTGIFGAAAATCISYIAVFWYRCRDTRKYVNIHILKKSNVLGMILLAAASGMMYVEDLLVCEILTGLCLVMQLFVFRKELRYMRDQMTGR